MKPLTFLVLGCLFLLGAIQYATALTATTPDGKAVVWIDEANQTCGLLTPCVMHTSITPIEDFCTEGFTQVAQLTDSYTALEVTPSAFNLQLKSEKNRLISLANTWSKLQAPEVTAEPIGQLREQKLGGITPTKTFQVGVDPANDCFTAGQTEYFDFPIDKAADDTVKVSGTFFGVPYDPYFVPQLLLTEASRDYSITQGVGTPGTWRYQLTQAGVPTALSYASPYQWGNAGCAGGLQGYFRNSSVAGYWGIGFQPCDNFNDGNITMNWTSNYSGYIDLIGWVEDQGGGVINFTFFKNAQQVNSTLVSGGGNVTLNFTDSQLVQLAVGDNFSVQIYNMADEAGDYGNFTFGIYSSDNPLDTIPPQFYNSTLFYNSTYAGLLTNFSMLWSDNVSLSGYIFSLDNGNGTFQNQSIQSFAQTNNSQSSIQRTLNATPDSIVRWYWFARDTSDRGNTTETYSLKTTSTPYFSLNAIDENSFTAMPFSISIQNSTSNYSGSTNTSLTGSLFSLPTGNVSLTVTSSNYYPRTFYSYINLTPPAANFSFTAYLVNNTGYNATANYYATVLSTGAPLANVKLDFYRSINGINTLVAEVFTTSGGGTNAIFLSPFAAYSLNAYPPGYAPILNLNVGGSSCPTSSTPGCTLLIGQPQNNSVGFYQSFNGIAWFLNPAGTLIYTNVTDPVLETRNFSFTISDQNSMLAIWGLNLTLNNGTVIYSNTSNSLSGGAVNNIVNVTLYQANSMLTAVMWFNKTNGDYQTWSQTYVLDNSAYSGNTFASIFNDMAVDSNDRLMYLVFILLLTATLATSKIFFGQSVGAFVAVPLLLFAGLANMLPWTIVFMAVLGAAVVWVWRRPN